MSNQFSNHHPWYMENGDLWPWNISGQGTHLLSKDLPNTSDRVAGISETVFFFNLIKKYVQQGKYFSFFELTFIAP